MNWRIAEKDLIAGHPGSAGIGLPNRGPKLACYSWEKLLLENFEDAMRAPSSAPPLMANLFVRTGAWREWH